MPEQISKYPEVTMKVLKGGGAQCGPGVAKKILKQCPSERFCSFPSGEICVYGLNQIPQMTQIKPPLGLIFAAVLSRVSLKDVHPAARRRFYGRHLIAGKRVFAPQATSTFPTKPDRQ